MKKKADKKVRLNEDSEQIVITLIDEQQQEQVVESTDEEVQS
jgi:hypothetical protein